jgi:hypothetical protein
MAIEGNRDLDRLMAEAGFTNSGLARRLTDMAKRTGDEARPSPTQVARWLKGQQPQAQAVALSRPEVHGQSACKRYLS